MKIKIIESMKNWKLVLSVLIIILSVILCQQIISRATSNQINKTDSAEINSIRYGLLSIDSWKQQISEIMLSEVEKLEFSKTNQKELKGTIERQLNVLIDRVNAKIRKSNEGSAGGWFKQRFINVFVSIEDIKKGIPQYADAMMNEMKKPKNAGKMKDLLKEKITTYINETFDNQDKTQVDRVLARTKSLDIESARIYLDQEIKKNNKFISDASIALIVISVILFLLPAFNNKVLPPYLYMSMVASLLILLLVGITTPMIDMEAKISQMSFFLMGHHVNFENQVLYFQTKSILDVFWLMMINSSIQMKFVGILMVSFSIVFPMIKLCSSLAYFYNYKNAQDNKWVQFFVLKSGKWSMADVLVVAIFMSYIGFNGIITSQLGKLSNTSTDIVIMSTNGNNLQPGFYLFLTYALLALFLSSYLTRKQGVND